MITVHEIVGCFLKTNNFDGLYNDDCNTCGCDGSAPCGGGPYPTCTVAYAGPGGLDDEGQLCDVLYYQSDAKMHAVPKFNHQVENKRR
jgi:hypothetical protein